MSPRSEGLSDPIENPGIPSPTGFQTIGEILVMVIDDLLKKASQSKGDRLCLIGKRRAA